MRGTHKENMVAQLIYGDMKHVEYVVSFVTIIIHVMYDNSISRVRINALVILYEA